VSNLKLRVISSIVLAVVVLALTWLGGVPFRLLAALITALVLYEWTRMCRGGVAGKLGILPEGATGVFVIALLFGMPALWLLLLLAVLVVLLTVVAMRAEAGWWEPAGVTYAGLSGFSLALLRDSGMPGLIAILFLFAVVWATDILAYFVGRAVGGPKLAPSISPGKTQSGAVGGAAGGVIAGVLLAAAAGQGGLPTLAVAALLLSIVSQAGDLFESWVKRRHGVKDSSNIIPGHGGVMDRVDGLVAAAFALYLIGWMLGSADHPAHGLFVP